MGITSSPLGDVSGYRSDGNSIYHALLAKAEKRFWRGFILLGSYKFPTAIGDTCGGSAQGNAAGCGYQDPRNIRQERAIDNQGSRRSNSRVFDGSGRLATCGLV